MKQKRMQIIFSNIFKRRFSPQQPRFFSDLNTGLDNQMLQFSSSNLVHRVDFDDLSGNGRMSSGLPPNPFTLSANWLRYLSKTAFNPLSLVDFFCMERNMDRDC